jgi:hypothetical protein
LSGGNNDRGAVGKDAHFLTTIKSHLAFIYIFLLKNIDRRRGGAGGDRDNDDNDNADDEHYFSDRENDKSSKQFRAFRREV